MNGSVTSSNYRGAIGRVFPAAIAEASASAMVELARAIGETKPIYLNEDAARAAGYPSLVAVPTYAFVLKHEVMAPADTLRELGIEGEAGTLLHAGQAFLFDRPIFAGDRLRFEERVASIDEKKGGSLVFVTLETTVSEVDTHERVCLITHSEVVRVTA